MSWMSAGLLQRRVCRVHYTVIVLAVGALVAGACRSRETIAPTDVSTRLVWSATLPGALSGESVASGDAVFATTDSGLASLDRDSGQLRWFHRMRGLAGSARLLVRGERILSAGSYSVQAHDRVTGRLLWERPFDPNVASPALSVMSADDANLYVGLRDGRALALAQSDGRIVWEQPIATPAWAFTKIIRGATIAGDTVYVTATRYLTANGFESAAVVVALDRGTGRELWRYQSNGTDTNIPHAASVSGDLLIFADGYRGYVIALDRRTGAERWRVLVNGFFFNGLAVRGDTLFAVTSTSRAYALHASTGRQIWVAELAAGATSAEVCASELVVGDFHVEVLSARDGRRVGLAFTGGNEEVVSSLVNVSGDVAYVGTTRRLMALRCR